MRFFPVVFKYNQNQTKTAKEKIFRGRRKKVIIFKNEINCSKNNDAFITARFT